MPPPWMSKRSPRTAQDMAEHSMCQPGRPGPYALSHLASAGSDGLADFHSTKSSGSVLPSATATRSPAQVIERLARQLAVALELAHGVVHVAVVALVGQALVLQRGDHRQHLRHVFRGARLVRG